MSGPQYLALHNTDAAFAGESIDDTSVLARYTAVGDANLGRKVDFNDYLRLQTHFGVASGTTFADGDFDYNGAVNFNDLLALQTPFGKTV